MYSLTLSAPSPPCTYCTFLLLYIAHHTAAACCCFVYRCLHANHTAAAAVFCVLATTDPPYRYICNHISASENNILGSARRQKNNTQEGQEYRRASPHASARSVGSPQSARSPQATGSLTLYPRPAFFSRTPVADV